jgi:hypothetical protein
VKIHYTRVVRRLHLISESQTTYVALEFDQGNL